MSTAGNKGRPSTLALSHAVWDGSYPLVLAEGWALTADENQWMLCQARGRTGKWQPVSFIGSNKRVLRRLVREKGVICTPDADAALSALPDDFIAWRDDVARWSR